MKPKLYAVVFCLFLFFPVVSACGRGGDPGEASPVGQQITHKESEMTQLSDAVLALDLSAADLAGAQGAAAVPELSRFLTHEDNAVRTVAVVALGAIVHPEATEALMKAARDEDDMVAGTAVEKLSPRADAVGAAALIRLLPLIKSDTARARLVLAVGKAASGSDANSLLVFCRKEQQENTALACLSAAARLGDDRSRSEFARYLTGTRDLAAFEMAEYIGQPWLLPHLGELLRHTDPVQTLGDPPPGFPNMLRVCDKAVVLIARISGQPFSFPTNVHMNYDERQIAEAALAAGMR
jgi:hypothetical protein